MKDRLGQLRLRFAELRLVRDGDKVQVYAGKDFSGSEVSVAVLAESAATDPGLRQAFAAAAGRARGTGASSVQSEVHAAIPWLAALHPEGQATIQRLTAELDRYLPAPPAGMVALTPLPLDAPPPPVRPDPTFAPTPPPIDLQPSAAPAPLAPTGPPTPRPSPTGPPPAPRTRRPVRGQPVAGPHRARATPAGRQLAPSTVVTLVVVILVGLAICGQAVLASVLG